MLLIPCPFCGERDETEFHCGGEAHIVRPRQPQALADPEWADYLFMRKNPIGIHHERWLHAQGCGRWFNAVRDTRSDRFLAVYRMGEAPPRLDRKAASSPSASRPRIAVVPAAEPDAGR
jgi:sarcosine oxidase subunit delta